jgi:hypothetical protein
MTAGRLPSRRREKCSSRGSTSRSRAVSRRDRRKGKDTKEAKDTKEPTPGEAKKDEPESFSVGPFSRDGSKLLITSKKGWYVLNIATAGDAQRTPVLTLDPDKEERNPKVAALEWAPDGSSIYATYSAPDRWERGVARLPLGRPAGPAASVLERSCAMRGSIQGADVARRSTFIFGLSDGDHPADLFTTDRDYKPPALTDLNASLMAGVAVPRSS